MGFVGEIPGMYYDQQKGKYFKIQANAPSKAAYSSYDIKRRKLEDVRTKAVADEKARQRGRIRRPMQEPLSSGVLAREYGNKGCLDSPRIFAKGLVFQGYSSDESWQSFNFIFGVQERSDLGPGMINLRVLNDDKLVTTRINAEWPSRGEKLKYETIDDLLGSPGPPTSISVHEKERSAVVTWMAGSPNSGIAVVPTNRIGLDDPRPNIILGPGHSRGSEVDVRSSTAAPESCSLLFAIGTSHGILTIDKENIHTHFLGHNLFPPGYSGDVFALEFLSNDPSVLISGGRSGILNITDLRVHDFGQQADTIKHQSSITHIKQLDNHRIIVAGLKSSLCQYDLRFRKGPKRTQSILQYPDYQNTASIRIGFDVDPESGIVAAAQEHDISHSPVQLFSLHGGHALQSVVSGIGRERPDHWPPKSVYPRYRPIESTEVVPCVRFVRDVEGKMKSLYIAADVVLKYGWGSRSDIERVEDCQR